MIMRGVALPPVRPRPRESPYTPSRSRPSSGSRSRPCPGENAAGLPLRGDELTGTLSGAVPGATLHLVRLAEPPAAQADAAVGNYDAGEGRTLLLTYRAHGELTAVLVARTQGRGEATQGGGEAIGHWLRGLGVVPAQKPPSTRPSASPITVATRRLVSVPTR